MVVSASVTGGAEGPDQAVGKASVRSRWASCPGQLSLDLGLEAGQLVESTSSVARWPHRSFAAIAVSAFHRAFRLPRRRTPGLDDVPESLLALRVRLLREEVEEFAEAAQHGDLVAMADALADVVYVAYGSAVTLGIHLDAVIAEVHRSNISKLDEYGRPVMRADGKVLKSERYRPPDVAGIIAAQPPLPR